ncbi:MAG: 50S ribosomal protein L33 [Candidatus Improbicoccus pseudotrichonymphae]|uniref:Large ribosomal subunit protein bL33 n=1 Tax=Candidatus Improbicoccus pseudotrichonymphae TaxID=3033792 RepID=A0AA48IH45_9FIRM|nr:MAG: 50S ribosomal protein L33 [Candidatus Improbicoccus pseudotrichonymphae]
MRNKVTLACSECKRRNYETTRNKKKSTEKFGFNKHCSFCRSHTLHKEVK